MVLGTVIRWGIPLSFVYCTIWQQDIWREGDERLIAEQKLSWKKALSLIDCSYSALAKSLNLGEKTTTPRLNLVSKVESMDFRSCWNSKVIKFFSSVDRTMTDKSFDLQGLTKSLGLAK